MNTEPPTKKPKTLLSQVLISRLVELPLVLILLATGCSFLARWHWFFDLFPHFLVQYAFFSGLLFVLALLFRRWKFAALGVVLIAINGWMLLPYWFGGEAMLSNDSKPVRVMSFNVLTKNTNYDVVIKFIQKESPDVIALLEVNHAWARELELHLQNYPYRRIIPREDNFGIAFFSKFPCDEIRALYLDENEVLSIEAKIKINARTVHFIATHPIPPMDSKAFSARNQNLIAATERFDKNGNSVLVGDFNLTPWSPWFGKVLEAGDLKDASKGFGIQPTWHCLPSLPLFPFGLKLDHLLTSRNIGIENYQIGPNLGSDHGAIFVDLILE